MITELLLTIIAVLIIAFIFIIATNKRSSYWKGRSDGWGACENMVIERARKHGYDTDELLSNILQ